MRSPFSMCALLMALCMYQEAQALDVIGTGEVSITPGSGLTGKVMAAFNAEDSLPFSFAKMEHTPGLNNPLFSALAELQRIMPCRRLASTAFNMALNEPTSGQPIEVIAPALSYAATVSFVPKVAATVPEVDVTRYLQLGAIKDADRAAKLANHARSLRVAAAVQAVREHGVTRIRVGPFTSDADRDQAASVFTKNGQKSWRVNVALY